jgi:hypothetical protein
MSPEFEADSSDFLGCSEVSPPFEFRIHDFYFPAELTLIKCVIDLH